MTVKELIELLQTHDPERVVVMSSDAEGNNYSPLADIGTGSYAAVTTWRGRFGLEELTPEHVAKGYGDGDVVNGVPALVLCPVN